MLRRECKIRRLSIIGFRMIIIRLVLLSCWNFILGIMILIRKSLILGLRDKLKEPLVRGLIIIIAIGQMERVRMRWKVKKVQLLKLTLDKGRRQSKMKMMNNSNYHRQEWTKKRASDLQHPSNQTPKTPQIPTTHPTTPPNHPTKTNTKIKTKTKTKTVMNNNNNK